MLIINGRILPMTGKEIKQGYLSTEGKYIKELGSMEQAPKPENGERPAMTAMRSQTLSLLRSGLSTASIPWTLPFMMRSLQGSPL